MKAKLMALLAKKKEARDAKVNKSGTIENVEELRGIMAEVDELNAEIRSIEDMINGMEDEPTNERTAAVNGTAPGIVTAPNVTARKADDESLEYRKRLPAIRYKRNCNSCRA